MFIETEATPNPSTLKFLPGKAVLADGSTRDFRDNEEAKQASPLAARLFEVPFVEGVFLGHDFIAVTKAEDAAWAHLKPSLLGAIMDHFMTGAPVLTEGSIAADKEDFAEEDRQTVDTIKELLQTRVRPAVAQDGGDITFQGYRDGVVYLHMRGACSGCPSSTATLKNGIENLLRHFLPDVVEVRPV
jgi:Fe-S cluster biogenesis protein NfuA